jgi:uncharacterized protein (TIRG00374 family)
VRTSLRLLLSIAVAAALLALLFAWGDLSLEELWETWRQLPLSIYLAGLVLHVCIYLLRSLRFRLLMPPEHRPDHARLLAVSAAHNMAALLLPAKTGEAALPLYLKKLCGVPTSEGLATLVVSRILDLASLCTILALSCHWMSAEVADAPTWMFPLALVLTAVAALSFAVSARSDWLVAGFTFFLAAFRLRGTKLGRKLDEVSHRVAAALRAAGGRGRLPGAIALSAPLWAGVFAFLILLARGFGLETSYGTEGSVFGAAWSLLAQMLPINVFAGAGTQEFGWVVGFKLLGVPEELALSTGLGVYTLYRLNVVLLGALGHLAMWLLGRAPSLDSAD